MIAPIKSLISHFINYGLSNKSSLVKNAMTRHALPMKIMAQLALFTTLMLSGVACSPASDRGPDSIKAKASTFDKATMDTLLGGAVESGELIGVQALVFDEGEVVYRGVFGLGDRERGTVLTCLLYTSPSPRD